MKLHTQRSAAAVDRLYAQALRLRFQQSELDQRLDRFRRWAVAVRQLRANLAGLLGVSSIGHALVGAQALLLVGDVFGRNADIQAQVQGGMHFYRPLLSLQLLNGFFQQADVCVETDGGDVAMLLAAEQISRAAK